MATYYYDFTLGDDTRTATQAKNKATPWKHHKYMTGATSNAAAYTHVAGDQHIFKGGETWDHTCFPMVLGGSGSSGAGNDYYGVDLTWYSGGAFARPVFDREYTAAADSMVDYAGQTRITLDNIEFRNLNTTTAFGIFLISATGSGGGDNSTISNCYIHGWRTTATNDDAHGGVGGKAFSPHVLTFVMDNCDVTNIENQNVLTSGSSTTSVAIGTGTKTFTVTGGLSVSAGQWVKCVFDQNNSVSGTVTSFVGGSLVMTVNNVLGSGTHSSWTISGPFTQNGCGVRMIGIIKNSRVYDLSNAILFPNDVDNCDVYNVTGDSFDVSYHTNGIYLDPYLMDSTLGWIRNSRIWNVYGGANSAYPNPHGGGDCLLYNNIIYGNITAQGAVEIDPYQYTTEGMANCTCYNNTIYNFDPAATAFRVVPRGTSQKLNILTLFNNHVMNAASVTDAVVGTDVVTYNNGTNLLQSAATATAQGYVLGNLYAPTLGGSTIGAGTDESSTFTTDIAGKTRTVPWDIGAYQFGSGVILVLKRLGRYLKLKVLVPQ